MTLYTLKEPYAPPHHLHVFCPKGGLHEAGGADLTETSPIQRAPKRAQSRGIGRACSMTISLNLCKCEVSRCVHNPPAMHEVDRGQSLGWRPASTISYRGIRVG